MPDSSANNRQTEQSGCDQVGVSIQMNMMENGQFDTISREELIEKLRESERRFRVTFEQSAVGLAHVALDGRWLMVNQKLCDILGYTREELLTKTFYDITYPEDWPINDSYIAPLLNGDIQHYTSEKRYVRNDGQVIWVNITASLVRDGVGTPEYLMTVVEDITERRRLDEQQRSSSLLAMTNAAELEGLIESISDALFVYDQNGQVARMNTAAQKMLGVQSYQEFTTLTQEERAHMFAARDAAGRLLAREEQPSSRLLRGETLTGGGTIDLMIRSLDGHEVEVNVSGAPLYDQARHIVGGVAIFREVTERRRLERRTHETLDALLSMAESLVFVSEDLISSSDDRDSAVPERVINPVAQRLAQLTRSVLGCRRVGISAVEPGTGVMRPIAVVGLEPEQERQWWIEQEQQQVTLTDSPMPELVKRLLDDEILVLDVTQPPFNEQPNLYNITTMLMAPMHVGTQLVGLLSLDHDGEVHVYTDEELALTRAVAKFAALVIERDRLLSQRAEAQANELAMRAANRRMDEFLGVASHELRNPLTTIKANIQLSLRRIRSSLQDEAARTGPLSEKLSMTQDLLRRAERQVEVLTRLVGDLLDVSRIQADKLSLQLRRQPTDLTAIVRETVQDQQQIHPERSIALTMPQGAEVSVFADAHRIGQVLTNYLTNALKYSASDRPVAVSLTVDDTTATIAVRDEGPGLSPDEQEHIWERFYQVQGVEAQSGSGIGLGLGLHISRTIIAQHDGQVGVESSPGVGSTFWFTLPLFNEVAPQ